MVVLWLYFTLFDFYALCTSAGMVLMNTEEYAIKLAWMIRVLNT